MQKYVFLDIHGVMSHCNDGGGNPIIDQVSMSHLSYVQRHTNCRFIITSSVRKDTVGKTKEYLTQCGFTLSKYICGVTIRAYKYINKKPKVHLPIPRGVEVKQWMDANIHSDNGKNFRKKVYGTDYTYAIIDNETGYLLEHRNNLIVTDAVACLTMQDAMDTIKILNQTILNFDHEKEH
jgi:hypothetical protein